MSSRLPIVSFHPLDVTVPARQNETVLDLARLAGVPLGNSCGGVGICARCRITVCDGAANLSEPTSVEIRFGTSRDFGPDERMACQAVVRGDCVVTTTYW